MTLETFFEKFDQFADAPNAVAKMRELVLQLAVTGKLVPQDERETPASNLLEAAQSERATLVASRKIKARPSTPVEAEERPFEIPMTWQWSRLSDVGYELGQKVPDQRFTYIDVGSIDPDMGRISDRVEVLEPNEAPSRARKLVDRGTVIYSTVRPYLLNIAIIDREFEHEPIASTAFGILHPFAGVNNRFLFYWLRSAPFTAYVQEGMKGMAYPAINDEKFYSGYIPVPPSAEQKRIVAKVDELMALCDRLETQQRERDTQQAGLARAAVARFAGVPTPANIDLLFHSSYTIHPADLRKTILTLAVQGKLSDGTAAKPVSMENLVGQANLRNGLSLRPTSEPSDYSCLPLSAMRAGQIDCSVGKPVSLTAEKAAPYLIRRGDVFVTRGNGSKDLVGRAGVVRCEPQNVIFPDLFIRIPLPPELVTADYFLIAWNSPSMRQTIERLAKTTSGIWKINQGHIAECEIPLPPLAEQRRIIDKVEQLMALVDQLEEQLAVSRAAAASLMEAVVAELTAEN